MSAARVTYGPTPGLPRVVVDTGPIVALLNARDEYHDWARETMKNVEPPLWTCEPVLAEASHLVRKLTGGPQAILALLARGILRVEFRVSTELMALNTLLTKYKSVPMSLADACLVRMTEMDPSATLMTLDSNFTIYRRSGRHTIPLIGPP